MVTNKKIILALGTGITFGFGFAWIILQTDYDFKLHEIIKYLRYDRRDSETISNSHELSVSPLVSNSTASQRSHDGQVQLVDDAEAQILAKQVRVLCWIMTGPHNHQTVAIHVKKTWGKRCNKLIFMSSESDENLGAIGLPNVEEGRDWLWGKTKEAFKYVWEHHRDDADWFMKADDDTFVIVENLRYMLSKFDTNKPVHFGLHFKPFVKTGYMSGGAGYVLSKEALRRFIEESLPDKNKCDQSHDGNEDVSIARCLEAVGVEPGDSRDSSGRYRFLAFPPEKHVMPGYLGNDSWYWERIYHPQKDGPECCSDLAISFHYVPPEQMYGLDYLVYHLHPYGISLSWKKGLSEDASSKTQTASKDTNNKTKEHHKKSS